MLKHQSVALLFLAIFAAASLVGCNTQVPREDTADARVSELHNGVVQKYSSVLPQVNSASEAVALADQALQTGNREQAILYYVQAVQLNPGDYESLYKIGVVHDALGNASLSAGAYQLALEANPRHAPSLEKLGLLLLREHKYDAAGMYLGQAVEIDPDRWRSHNGLGVLADLRGDYGEAVRHYQSAIRVEPNSPKLLSNLGYSYYLQDDLTEAQVAFERAVKLDPQFRTGRYNLALVHARRGDYADALGLLTEAGNAASAYNDLGYICILLGEYDRARQYLAEAIRISPSYYKKAEDNLLFLQERMRAKRQ